MALQEKTVYLWLDPVPSSLHGLRFRSLTSVDEIAGHPSSEAGRVVLAPIPVEDYVLDAAAGTIARTSGLASLWARVIYQYDDAPDPNVVAAAQATADFLATLPGFRDNLAAALMRLNTGAGNIQTQADSISTSATTGQVPTIVAGLQTAVIRTNTIANCAADTQAAIRNAGIVLESMRTAHNLEALAIKDEAVYLRRAIQVLASSLGIPLA